MGWKIESNGSHQSLEFKCFKSHKITSTLIKIYHNNLRIKSHAFENDNSIYVFKTQNNSYIK